MLILIESDAGEIVSDFAFCGYLGASKENWLKSDSYKIVKASINSLSFYLTSTKYEHILPIGSLEFIKKSAEILGFEMPKPLNIPESLKIYCGRKVWESNIENLSYPCFIKPLDEAKLFTGFVAKSVRDFSLYPELKGFEGKLMCSEPIDNILSEWRCFVLKGKVINCSNYSGDPLIFPDKRKIDFLINKYYDAPAGYSLDVCINDKETKLVEVNDGWGLGNYGCEPQDYFKLLKERWFEILKNKKYGKK
jgi:hypothetical protein